MVQHVCRCLSKSVLYPRITCVKTLVETDFETFETIKADFNILECPRTGGRDLKRTQIYPAGYGEQVYKLHKMTMDSTCCCINLSLLHRVNLQTPCISYGTCVAGTQWTSTSSSGEMCLVQISEC